MPTVYNGKVQYWPTSKFESISRNNLNSYTLLDAQASYSYYLCGDEFGFVFDNNDLADKSLSRITPIMRVSLRDYPELGLKQAHVLRIQEKYARQQCATTWYELYAKHAGGIVCDNEHLMGGFNLWKSFLATGKCFMYDPSTKELTPVNSSDENRIWGVSPDKSKQNLVLVFKP